MVKLVSRPLTVATLDDLVYESLRDDIVRGLAPGTPLRLAELAAHFEVSIMPVRAALARLAGDGLVRQAPHRGAFVAPLELEDIEEVQALRSGIEGYAAQLGANAATDEILGVMESLLERLATVADGGSVDTYLKLEGTFHATCYAAAGRPRLLRLVANHRRAAERYIRVALSETSGLAGSVDHQIRFLEACRGRDGDRAAAELRRALAWTVGQVRVYLASNRNVEPETQMEADPAIA